jgi:hypothetical protein
MLALVAGVAVEAPAAIVHTITVGVAVARGERLRVDAWHVSQSHAWYK